MSTNSPINGIRIPELSDTANIVNAVGQAVTDIDTRLMARFATPAARDLAIASPVSGMRCWVDSFNLPMIYYTSYWGFEPGTPVASLYQSVAQGITTGVSGESISFDGEEFDLLNGHSTSVNTERYTPSVPGRYEVAGSISYEAVSGGNFRAGRLLKNAVTPLVGSEDNTAPSSTFQVAVHPTGIGTANGTTDYFSLYAVHDRGSDINTYVAGANAYPTLRITYMGPS